MFAPLLALAAALLVADALAPQPIDGPVSPWAAAVAVTAILPHLGVRFLARPRPPRGVAAWRVQAERMYGPALVVGYALQLWLLRWRDVAERLLPLHPSVPWARAVLAPVQLLALLAPLGIAWILSLPARRALLGETAGPGTAVGILLRLRQVATLTVPYLVLQFLGGQTIAFLDAAVTNESHRRLALWAACASAAWGLYAAAPWMLSVFWRTAPLPEGPLRDRLETFARRVGLPPERLRIAATGDRLLNACGVGLLPRWQFVVVSDALARHLEPAEVEGVVAHEVGHLQCRHFAIYLLYGVTCLAMLLAAERAGWTGPADASHAARGARILAAGAAGMGAWIVCLRFIGRRLERQADQFAASVLQGSGPLRAALERIGTLGGPRARRPTLLHGSLLSRIEHLRRIESSPDLAIGADRAVRRIALVLGGILLPALFSLLP